jgi:uncharacterized protein YggE
MIEIEKKQIEIISKSMIAVLMLLGVFLATKSITQIIDWSNKEVYPARTITVSGDGEVLAIADIASFSFSVNEEGQTSQEAQSKATEKMNTALAYLKDAGVEEKDLKTENYSIYPKYENVAPCYAFDCPPANPKIVGYTVSQSIKVKVRNIDNAGKFVTELTKFGINNISGISFTIDDEDKIYAEARTEAISNTQEKAETLARDLGVKLGKITAFYEETPNGYQPEYGRGGDMMVKTFAEPSLPQGENTYKVRVNVTYELK